MRTRQFLLPLSLLLSVSIPVARSAASPVGGGWTEYSKLTASNARFFGDSVAISGSTAIVGAFGDNSYAGAAYVFDVTTGEQLHRLTALDAASRDEFGRPVAISGNTAIVGAGGNDDAGGESGSAYLFDVITGNQLRKLTASDAAEDHGFGRSVSISGNIAIIGAVGNGSAYIFDVSTWNELLKLTSPDPSQPDHFGASVAVGADTAIVGAYLDDELGDRTGAAYVFDAITGEQLHKLTASDPAVDHDFGRSVAISGNTAIVGATHDGDGGYYSGAAYLFDVATGEQLHKLTALDAGADDLFGYTVSISANTALVGAYRSDDKGPYTGSAYLFDVTTGSQIQKLSASDAWVYNKFGVSVCIDGRTAIIGAADSAYVFIPEPSTLVLLCMSALGLLVYAWRRRK